LTDISASKMAIELIKNWNTSNLVDKMIRVNLPELWTFDSKSIWSGRQVLQEPYILKYQKFNSNSGWADTRFHWPRVMQALSHFSYHISDGEYLLCDLQGGVYRDGVVLTDPVVMSVNENFGPTDLGRKGMATFFVHHQCNEFCRPGWKKPSEHRSYYCVTAGTTMISACEYIPSMNSRPRLSLRRL